MSTPAIRFSRVQDLKHIYKQLEPEMRQSFRIEAEHALRVVNDGNRKINNLTRETLIDSFKANITSMESTSKKIASAIADLHTPITNSLKAVENAIVDGFHGQAKCAWELHLDNIGTQDILNDMLRCMVDKENFLQVLEQRKMQAAEDRRRNIASSNYARALLLYKRALYDNDIGKAEAMNQEALTLFERAYSQRDFSMMAAFHLGELHQRFTGNTKASERYFLTSLGPKIFSDSYIRSAVHLSHLYYRQERYKEAFDLLNDIALHFDRINAMCVSLAKIQGVGWPKCQDKLEETLRNYQDILKVSDALSGILALFRNQQRFTATETFLNMLPMIQLTLASLKPDLWVYKHCAIYARRIGQSDVSRKWIQRLYSHHSDDVERRLLVMELMSIQEFKDA